MKNLLVGVHIATPKADGTVQGIVAAERAGIDCAWMTSGGAAPDPLAVFAAAAMRTERIRFGTSIMPTFPRHPLALVQSAIVVDSLAPGRLRLGVGPSHKPAIEGTWGLAFDRPLQHLREYLLILKAALGEGTVNFTGKRLSAHAQVAGGPTQVTVMASALRPNGFGVCGELADGAISWVCPLPYLRDVAVTEDVAGMRAAAARQIGFYPRVPFYSQMFQDAGFPEAKEGQLSERMIDALVVHGSAEQVKARLRKLPSFGASELLAMPIVAPGDEEGFERTLAVLGELAREG